SHLLHKTISQPKVIICQPAFPGFCTSTKPTVIPPKNYSAQKLFHQKTIKPKLGKKNQNQQKHHTYFIKPLANLKLLSANHCLLGFVLQPNLQLFLPLASFVKHH
ncbi:MAG: hypothetical protein J7F05_00620, partial [Trichodesmium erythraeum GBRTRLIN201]|nr:hypothetical protein [Trichodesmium erythraeum GBRTRLIN201]